ncbi:MAG: tol-pal system YbgF family protein, partial [Terriglobales bacterium]
TKTRALLAYRQGSVEEGLAVYDKSFQPLWPPELVKDYFDLLKETRSQRKFVDQSRAALVRNPDDLNAAARIFYYYQQLGNFQAAQQTITDYRLQKDARKAQWTSQELYTFARLLEDVHLYPESARYYYALYNSPGTDASAPEKALAGLARILLTAPEQQIRLGSGDLSMFRDIANMDTGPGYLNGILSLLLNTTQPAANYSEEEQRAVPYFHRSRAAEFLTLLDKRFPNSSARPELHARLIEAYAGYGQSDAVIRAGREFLSGFPSAPQRNQVALLMADAFARTNNTKEEFAIYDSMLQELARKAEGVPLGERFNEAPAPSQYQDNSAPNNQNDAEGEGDDESGQRPTPRGRPVAQQGAFAVSKSPSATQTG